MSRIGVKPIAIPAGVKVAVQNRVVAVEGPLGSLKQALPDGIDVVVENGSIRVKRVDDATHHKALHGLVRSLIANMVTGVTSGYSKSLEIYGVGYSAKIQGSALVLELGFAQPVTVELPKGIKVEIQAPTNPARFTIKGCDKQLVGEMAARIRRLRPPEPYQGKGIRYADEKIRRKAGKTFAATG